MERQFKLSRLTLLSLNDLGDEPFEAEVLVKEEGDDFWYPIEVRGRATFDPYDFDDTFTIEFDDTIDPQLARYLRRKLKEKFRELVEKEFSTAY